MLDLTAHGRLFHFSDDPRIRIFSPRPSHRTLKPAVWAIHEPYEYQYLFPRGCPRVTYCANALSDRADIEVHLSGGEAPAVVAFEAGWLERMLSARLYRYELPPETFIPQDTYEGSVTARALVSYEAVTPVGVESMENLLGRLGRLGVEARMVPSLWNLRDRILASSLPFSFIRMGNAQPREEVERA